MQTKVQELLDIDQVTNRVTNKNRKVCCACTAFFSIFYHVIINKSFHLSFTFLLLFCWVVSSSLEKK